MLQARSALTSRVQRNRIVGAAVFLATLLAASASLPPRALSTQESGPVISTSVNLVVLPVTVTDRKGEFVQGLDAANFRIDEDGRPQKIEVFRHEDTPVTAGLLVDHSGSMAIKMGQVIQGAMAFVQASNPEDREFVVNFSDTVTFGLPADVDFTSDTQKLEAAVLNTPASGQTALYDALIAALKRLEKDSRDKKVLVLVSDGGDNASKHSFAEALRMAQSSNVIIYTLGLFDEHSFDQNPKVLTKIAKETGGEVYFPKSAAETVSVCRQIAGDIRRQYTLGYSPTDTRPGYRRIHVSVTAPDRGKLFARTRAGYYFSGAAAAPSAAGQMSSP
ncbi:MAG: VWA domain-containing protein [Candidatus Acidiferrales bacterium]